MRLNPTPLDTIRLAALTTMGVMLLIIANSQSINPLTIQTFPVDGTLNETTTGPLEIEFLPQGIEGMPVISINSGDWNAPNTWDCSCVPGSLHDVTIFHDVVLNLNATVANITIDASGSLAWQDVELLQVSGDWVNYGIVDHAFGTVEFNGLLDQSIVGVNEFYNFSISGSHIVQILTDSYVAKQLSVQDGTLYPNGMLTMQEIAGETAQIRPIINGQILGDIIIERSITSSNDGWLTIAAPAGNSTIAEWNDDFVTTGFIGADYPNYSFTSIQYYEEESAEASESFMGIDSVSQLIVPGLGYYVYANSGTYNFESAGQPIIGNFSFPIDFTENGNLLDDGLNVCGNPYVSNINWDEESGWDKTNMNSAIYIWDVSQKQFRVYSNGYGINGGSSTIKTGETFWVQANAPNASMDINENAKIIGAQTTPNAGDDFFLLSMVGDGNSDELILAFNQASNEEYNPLEDAFKFFSDGNTPNIASTSSDGINLSINAMPLGVGDFDVSIIVHAPSGGDFNLNILQTPILTSDACVFIEDIVTGEMYDMFDTETIAFTTEPIEEEIRFLIHVGGIVQVTTDDVSCFAADDGELMALGSGNGPWDYTWYDADMNIIQSTSALDMPDLLDELGPGNYSVVIDGNDFCDGLTASFTITEPTELFLTSDITHLDCDETYTGMITVDLSGGIGPYSYNWSNGATGNTNIELSGGDYDLDATDDSGCLFEQTFTVIEAPSVDVFFQTDTQIIDLIDGSALIEMENLSEGATEFAWDFGDGTAIDNDENPVHEYIAEGTYIISLDAANETCTGNYQIVIQVQEGTGVEETEFTQGTRIIMDQGNLYLQFDFSQARRISITGFNLLGQTIMQAIAGTYGHERVELRMVHKVPVGLIEIRDIETGQTKTFKIVH